MIAFSHGTPGLVDLDEVGFILDVLLLTILALPMSITYVLWSIFITNRCSPPTSVLGLRMEHSSATEARWYIPRISAGRLALYTIMTVLTFDLGPLAFNLYRYLSVLVP
jgi:hypothetical protein